VLKIFKNQREEKQLPRNYRFYPIYLQVILRSFGNTTYGLALPNYLIFHEHFNPGLVGVIYAIFAAAYIFGPIVARPITERIGLRNALIFAAIVPVITTAFQLLFFMPVVLITCRAIEGILLGFFWPNVQMQVAVWQKTCPMERSEGMFRVYGFSWNFGCLLGAVFGLFVVYIGQNDFLGLIVGWIGLAGIIPFAILMEHAEDTLDFDGQRAIVIINHTGTPVMGARAWSVHEAISKQPLEVKQGNNHKHPRATYDSTVLACIPIGIAVVVQMVHGAMRSMFNFTYPLFLYAAGWESYWSYLIIFSQLITQMLGINWSGHLPPRGKYLWFLIGGFACLAISALILAYPEMTFVTVLNVALGFFNGLVYAFGAQVMLAHGKLTGSLKYVTIYEIFSGIGYGVTPLVAGFVADISLLSNFLIIASLICIGFTTFTIMTWEIARQKLLMKAE
jgi:MFS family permease